MRVLGRQLSGLGNQLFQYAAGRYFADRYMGELTLIQEPVFGTLSHGIYKRPFLLSHFQLAASVRMKTRFDDLMLAPSGVRARLVAPIKAMKHIAVRHEVFQRRYEFMEDLAIPQSSQTLYLTGYWQAYQYADAIAPQLRQELLLREPATGSNQWMLEEIKSAPVSISLHVRRGDYTLAKEGNIALPLDYYRRAIELVRQRWENPSFFIFSDDIAFARENLPKDICTVFVEGNDDDTSHEDLRLMSACQHHIIANSSFSWWGAWLNPMPDKVVVAPRHWHLSAESDYPDLLPPTWHAIDSLRS